MRHGERQDMADPSWPSTATRPWDPPLSAFGVTQAAERGAILASAGVRIDCVVTSPFSRCIQTSAALMTAMGMPPHLLMVDASVCEWMSSRNLNLGHVRSEGEHRDNADVQQWFWGEPAQAGIRAAVTAAWSAEAAAQVSLQTHPVTKKGAHFQPLGLTA